MRRSYLFLLGFFLIALGFGAKEANSYKILTIFPSFSQSHVIVASGLLKGLAKKGHEVTMVSAFPQSKPLRNYRDVVLPINADKDAVISEFIKNAGNKWDHLKLRPYILQMSYELANQTMTNPDFKKMLEEESFDLLILGVYSAQFLLGLAHHFNCPVAIMSQVQAMYMAAQLVGNPLSVAATSHASLGYLNEMTFGQRVKNFLTTGVEMLMTIYHRHLDRKYYESIFPEDKYPTYDESLTKVSLVLVNHHFSQGFLRAYVPAMVEIGGIHIEDETDHLPKDIQEFLDSATDGAIFFSFGTNVKSSLLHQGKLDAILKSFGRLKEKVLFKWETDSLLNKSDNMMIGKWMPQRDILAHKNLKLFVSHGGMGSITEAKYRGVPIVGVPIYGDQIANVGLVCEEGWGYQLNYNDLTEESFSLALKEVLTNPKYAETARRTAFLYKDRPQTALETANYWIEYIIRHKGAPHMKSHAVYLNFWEYNSIDVIVFFLIVLYLLFKLSVFGTKFFCRRFIKFFSSKQKQL